jgi:hypothetical protein
MTLGQKLLVVAVTAIAIAAAALIIPHPTLAGVLDSTRDTVCSYISLDWLRCPQDRSETPDPTTNPGPSPSTAQAPSLAPAVSATPTPWPTQDQGTGLAAPQDPSPTPSAPLLVKRLRIPGTSEQGITWTPPASGTYRIVYEGGAYDVKRYNAPSFMTTVRGYLGDAVRWDSPDGRDQAAPDYESFNTSWWSTRDEAESAAKGLADDYDLEGGRPIVWVACDRRGYFQNPGSVTIAIYSLSEGGSW